MSVDGPGKVVVEVSAQMPGKQAGLDKWQQGRRYIPVEMTVRPSAVTATLPSVQHGAPPLVGEPDGWAGQLLKVAIVKFSSVEESDSEPVGEQRPELFHQVERERWLAWTDTMQVTDVGV